MTTGQVNALLAGKASERRYKLHSRFDERTANREPTKLAPMQR
ncbi:MAG TPA: hypothetical protein VI072_01390 [Polyangiaceae bacterium]